MRIFFFKPFFFQNCFHPAASNGHAAVTKQLIAAAETADSRLMIAQPVT
jgi:hypothetical protein